MTPTTLRKIKELGLSANEFTIPNGQSFEGKVVLADPTEFGEHKDNCLFRATGGFGCDPNARGSCVFATRLSDGQAGRIERSDIIAVHV